MQKIIGFAVLDMHRLRAHVLTKAHRESCSSFAGFWRGSRQEIPTDNSPALHHSLINPSQIIRL
jgi:hypothetical protein